MQTNHDARRGILLAACAGTRMALARLGLDPIDPFPYTHPLLSACHGARGAPYWLFPDAAPDLVISKQAENVEFPTSPKSDLTRSPSLWVP